MKNIVIEIDDCRECPFVVDMQLNLVCSKTQKEIPDIGEKEDNPVFNCDMNEKFDIPSWCPQQLDSKTPLTESNITDYGFEISHYNDYWENYRKDDFSIKYYLKVRKFEYEDIKIDTVEELKSLYKLITKKELT